MAEDKKQLEIGEEVIKAIKEIKDCNEKVKLVALNNYM